MLTAVILLAIVPACLILVLGLVARAFAAQPVTARVVQYAPERGTTLLRDAVLADADKRAAAAALIDLAVKRKVRLIAGTAGASAAGTAGGASGSRSREPIGVELTDGARLTTADTALLEVLFGPEHTGARLRRFSADRRALAGRLKTLMTFTELALAREGLVGDRRVTWPGTTLTVLAYLGMLVEALLLVFTLIAGDWTAFFATLAAVAVTIATIFVTPASWRRYLPPSLPHREHLAGLRRYLEVAEADRLRVLQSPSGAELRADAPAGSIGGGPSIGADPEASAQLERFHLHERLLPYAVLFGLEREWLAKLRLEADTLAHTNVDTLGDLVDVTAEVAAAIDAAGGVLELTAVVGDLVDGTGSVIEGIGGIFEGLGS
ncbi:DUF2207 domain-containing protein [Agromyces sp. H3Y2-19a]|uniref:DUF2207 domain-containing protein n=1 Tax=Agromyces TaxID=33877 RepID=UPI001E56C3B0|nr:MULTISPECIES: DUF2207 domain-containing protein [Agromyces]MCD5345958.1 DUF2207 domain-containing protein [Agromyces sp. S2-1-8]MDF0512326.1 DUF2207 domain-containing protein [Agromyces chromiiresistens]